MNAALMVGGSDKLRKLSYAYVNDVRYTRSWSGSGSWSGSWSCTDAEYGSASYMAGALRSWSESWTDDEYWNMWSKRQGMLK